MEQKELTEVKSMGLQDVKAFQVNGFYVIAAYTTEEAVAYYEQEVDAEETHEVTEVPLTNTMWDDEEQSRRITFQEAIDRYWNGSPLIICVYV